MKNNLTTNQTELLEGVKENQGLTTAELRRALGYAHQGYESYLRDRLFRLEARGLVRSEEKKNSTHVIARRWFAQEVSA